MRREYLHNLNPFGVCFKSQRSQCTDIDVSEILELLANHFLVVIKGFTFSKFDDYIHFLEKLGKPFTGHMWCSHPKSDAIQLVTNKKICHNNTSGLFSGAKVGWHTDGMFSDNPEQIVCLYCKTPGDSASQFLDTSLAVKYIWKVSDIDIDDIVVEISSHSSKTLLKERFVDSLPKKEYIDLCKYRNRNKNNTNIVDLTDVNREFIQTKSFIRKHPLSLIEGCFFPKLNVVRLLSRKNHNCRNEDFSRLCKLIFRKEFIYTHQWEKGDMILIDQVLTLHQRSKCEGERELFRSALWYH